jgi:hypothetical protein
VADSEDERAEDHQHERLPGNPVTQRHDDREDDGEEGQARREVEDVRSGVRLLQGVDQPPRRGLVAGRKLVRVPNRGAGGDPDDRVEGRVEDHVRKDQRPSHSGGAVLNTVHEQPDRVCDRSDQEELHDVQDDEHACRVAGTRVVRRMDHHEGEVQERRAEEKRTSHDELALTCHVLNSVSHSAPRRARSKKPTTRRSYSSGCAVIPPMWPASGISQSSFGSPAAK